ncbi:MAG: ion transporter [Theionarchaea archaeon]|nr:ion transporter [Theionarchaea archaeon]
MKRRIYEILEIASNHDPVSRGFDIFLIALITINVLAVILETVQSLAQAYASFFETLELISIIIFTTEYILRLWTCTENERYAHPVFGRVRYSMGPMPLIDLCAVLPFYLPVILPMDPRFMRSLRLFRLFRLFKMGRYSESLQTMGNVIKNRKEELVVTIFVIFIMLVMASSLVYTVEHDAQPEAFSSIPAAMWWGIATLTTVGYGDVYPITPLGKFLGAVIAMLGIGLFALPAGILASGFAGELQKKDKKVEEGLEEEYREAGKIIKCPHCGKNILEPSREKER